MLGPSPTPWKRRVIPGTLGLAMLIVVILAALAPNTGTVRADTTCQYGNCQPTTTTSLWTYLVIAAIVIVAAVLAGLLILRQRRRRPPAGAPWAETGAEEGGAAVAAGPEGPYAPMEGEGALPPYMEGPEDTGAMPAPTPSPRAAVRAPAVEELPVGEPPAPPPTEETNIDALMEELDRISSEILKRDQRGKGPPPNNNNNEKSDNPPP